MIMLKNHETRSMRCLRYLGGGGGASTLSCRSCTGGGMGIGGIVGGAFFFGGEGGEDMDLSLAMV